MFLLYDLPVVGEGRILGWSSVFSMLWSIQLIKKSNQLGEFQIWRTVNRLLTIIESNLAFYLVQKQSNTKENTSIISSLAVL